MALIDEKFNIETIRGDVLPLKISARLRMDKSIYTFKPNDVIRFKIMDRNNCKSVILQKEVLVEKECDSVRIVVPSEEMKIGSVLSKPVDYWYEVELNPHTSNTITILGYTKKDGPKILTLCPEGGDKE